MTTSVEQAFAPSTTITARIEDGPRTITVDWQGVTVSQIQEMAARYILSRTKATGKGEKKTPPPADGATLQALSYLPRGTRQLIPAALVKRIDAMNLDNATRDQVLALLAGNK